MRNDDADVGQFNALLADLAELQTGRGFAKAMATPRPTRREFVPRSHFSKAQRASTDDAAARTATAADLARAVTGIERLAAETAKLRLDRIGEQRARVRAQVNDVLRRAMEGVGRGTVTALEVSRLEARAHRVLADLDKQQGSVQVRARVAA